MYFEILPFTEWLSFNLTFSLCGWYFKVIKFRLPRYSHLWWWTYSFWETQMLWSKCLCQRKALQSEGQAGAVEMEWCQSHHTDFTRQWHLGSSWQLHGCALAYCALVLYGIVTAHCSHSLLQWVCKQPLDGGISPLFFFSLVGSTSQNINLISMISYRILMYAKFTVYFSNIQSRKTHKSKVHSLSNS